jgi:hypothetical protein
LTLVLFYLIGSNAIANKQFPTAFYNANAFNIKEINQLKQTWIFDVKFVPIKIINQKSNQSC